MISPLFSISNLGNKKRSSPSSSISESGKFSNLAISSVAPVGLVEVMLAQPLPACKVTVNMALPKDQLLFLGGSDSPDSRATISFNKLDAGFGSGLP